MEKFHQQLKSVPCHLPSHRKKRIVVRKSSTFQGIDTCPVMQMLKDSFYSRPVYFYFICPSNVRSGILAVKIGQKITHLCGRKIRSSSHSRAKAAKDASVISTSIPADFLWNNLIYFFTSVQSWLPAIQAWSKARKTMITLILEGICQHYQNISNTSTSTILKS